jgi:predicted transcriptional regulator
VAIDYPGFDAWLERQWQNPQVSKKVVEVGRAVAAYSMWRKKDARHVKLQTFFVGPLFRGTAIGQHLLYHELRTWGRDPSIRKIWLTVAASKVDLIRYLCHFGFRVEGFAANRYARRGSATEVVLARHLVRRAVRSVDDLRRLVAHLRTVTWGMDKSSADGNRFGVPSAAMAVPASFPGVRVKIEHPLPPTGAARLVLHDTAGHIMMSWDDVGLMREFYPLRMHLPDRRYVAVPIYRKWVNAFFGERDQPAAGTAVRRLRVDHVYYCYPKIPDLAPGDLIVFYEPRLGGGRGAAIGAAVVREVRIQPPDALYRRFRGLGVYRKADVQRHAKAGKAMAIHFDLYESFIRPVPLERIRAVMGTSTRMQGLTPLGREAFERIRAEGLAES